MSTSPELELVWDGGSLDLLGENDTPYGPVTFNTVGEGTEWGNPQSVRRTLWSAMADGSALTTERHDNRTVVVKLRLTAPDSAALAGGEAVLHLLASKRRAELRWTPPNDFAAPAAFIIVASDLTHEMDDLDETRVQRSYSLALTCLPWTRSIAPVVIEALPPFVAAPTTLDPIASSAAWSTSESTTVVSYSSGRVIISANPAPDVFSVVTYTGTLARAKRYLAIESTDFSGGRLFYGSPPISVTTTTGTHSPPLAGIDGSWKFFDLPAALGNILSFSFTVRTPSNVQSKQIGAITTIAESDDPAISAGRQSLRVISTPGSARADGSLAIAARDASEMGAGTKLGQVIVYTGPQYDPRLSVGRVDTVEASTLAMSGGSVVKTDGSFTFERPASDFANGAHSVWVHALGADGGETNWDLTVDAVPVGAPAGAFLDLAPHLTVSTRFVTTGYNLFNLGTIDLPGFDVGAASGLNLRFTVAATGFVRLDEVLVFNRTLGRLTIVDTRARQSLLQVGGSWTLVPNGGATRVWLDAASLGGSERVVAGSASRELAVPASMSSELRSWDGSHLFTPDATYLYVGTTGTIDPEVTGQFRPAWHTHPAE